MLLQTASKTEMCQDDSTGPVPPSEVRPIQDDRSKSSPANGIYTSSSPPATQAGGSINTQPVQTATSAVTSPPASPGPPRGRVEVRLLVRRREAGALIGKRGANIKRLREVYNKCAFNIPDTGNGPERVVCVAADGLASLEAILAEISQLFLEKAKSQQPLRLHKPGAQEDQIELKQLINSAHAGLLIGMGGQSIRKLRHDSKAAIKIYEICCPHSNERVCAIKAKPPVVVSTIRMIQEIIEASPPALKASLVQKPYDALNFDLRLLDKYGGYAPDDLGPLELMHLAGAGAQSSAANLLASRHQCLASEQLGAPRLVANSARRPSAGCDGVDGLPRALRPHSMFPAPLVCEPSLVAATDGCSLLDSLASLPGHLRAAPSSRLAQDLAPRNPARFHPYLSSLAPADVRSLHLQEHEHHQLILQHLRILSAQSKGQQHHRYPQGGAAAMTAAARSVHLGDCSCASPYAQHRYHDHKRHAHHLDHHRTQHPGDNPIGFVDNSNDSSRPCATHSRPTGSEPVGACEQQHRTLIDSGPHPGNKQNECHPAS